MRALLRVVFVGCVFSFVTNSLGDEISGSFLKEQEAKFVKILNAERAKYKLPPLEVDFDLTAGAQRWCISLRSGIWAHGAGDECIARGAVGAEGALLMWLNSPPHRDTILSRKYTTMGIGNEGNYWTFRGGNTKPVTRTRTVTKDVPESSVRHLPPVEHVPKCTAGSCANNSPVAATCCKSRVSRRPCATTTYAYGNCWFPGMILKSSLRICR